MNDAKNLKGLTSSLINDEVRKSLVEEHISGSQVRPSMSAVRNLGKSIQTKKLGYDLPFVNLLVPTGKARCHLYQGWRLRIIETRPTGYRLISGLPVFARCASRIVPSIFRACSGP